MNTLFLVVKGSVGQAAKSIVVINQALSLMIKLWKAATYPARVFFNLLKTASGIAVSAFKKVYETLKTVAGIITDVMIGALTRVKDLVWDIATKAFAKLREVVIASISDFLEFEREADRAFGLIAGVGVTSFEQIKDAAIRVSLEVKKDLTEVTQAFFDTISAGFRDVAEADF